MSLPGGPMLLVDADPDAVRLTQQAFASAHLANPLHVVGDGEEALAYLGGRERYADRSSFPLPMLLLLDLELPRRSGLEVLAWVRSQSSLSDLPVAVLTSPDHASALDQAYELGANSALAKPVDIGALRELVRKLGFYWMVMEGSPSQ